MSSVKARFVDLNVENMQKKKGYVKMSSVKNIVN